jgi:hypothetical protein
MGTLDNGAARVQWVPIDVEVLQRLWRDYTHGVAYCPDDASSLALEVNPLDPGCRRHLFRFACVHCRFRTSSFVVRDGLVLL